MSRISAEDAFLMLAKWNEDRAELHLVMTRPVGQRAASPAVVNEVLPHSQKVLLTLRDENGEDVDVTVSLEGAEWENYDASAVPTDFVVSPEFTEGTWAGVLSATFVNGNRYLFGEKQLKV